MNTNDDKVSVVIPVYNAEKYLRICVESLLSQTYSKLEIILIDDGSNDSSPEICDELAGSDIRVRIFHKKNGGVSSARNLGIDNASGNYIMFVDADDWLDNNAIELMVETINKNKTDACVCDRYYKDDNVQLVNIPQVNDNYITSDTAVKWHLKIQFPVSPCLALSRLSNIKQCHFDETIHALEDWEYNFRMLTFLKSISVLRHPLYHYRTVVGSASKSNLNDRKMTCFLIPDKVNSHILDFKLPYEKEAKYVPVFLLNHMLVILANGDYVTKPANDLKRHAKRMLLYAIFSVDVSMRQKLYVLMTVVSPKFFYDVYRLKYRRRFSCEG